MAERIRHAVSGPCCRNLLEQGRLGKGRGMRAQQRDLFVSPHSRISPRIAAERAVASATTPVQKEAAEAAEAEAGIFFRR